MMNDFGIADSRMMGYWLDDVPVHTDNADVLASAYVRDGGVLIVLGSWSGEDEVVDLTLDLTRSASSSRCASLDFAKSLEVGKVLPSP